MKSNHTPIELARMIQPELGKKSIAERLKPIQRLGQLILQDQEKIIDRIQEDTHKSRSDALMSEIFTTLEMIDYLTSNAKKVLKDRKAHTPLALLGKKSWVYFEPVGVVLVISPWNYPFYQAIAPIMLSYVCGNATLYKPSEHTPLKGLIEELLTKAGFEGFSTQVIYGDGKVGEDLISQGPDKIFFTGSVKTGKSIMSHAAVHLIPVELELGGKDPMIVFDDCNLRRAAAGAAWGALTNGGQACTSVERIYVQRGAYEEFKKELLNECNRVKLLKKGEKDSNGDYDYGSMTVPFQVDVIRDHLNEAKEKGAKILTGQDWDGKSEMIPPICLEDLNDDLKIMRDETFGPVLPLRVFETEEEVISLANDSIYGLSASVWSKDIKRAVRVSRALKTGNVSINNVMLSEGNHALPFGGVKQSGIGRYKGEFGFYGFSSIKSVLIDADSKKIEANWYPYTATKYQLFTKMMQGLFGGGIFNTIKFAISGLKLESYSTKVGYSGRDK